MTSTGLTVIVDEGIDLLGTLMDITLRRRGHATRFIPSNQLASHVLTLDGDELWCENDQVRGVIFHARPDADFGQTFVDEDRSFAAQESRAVWLAAHQLPSVLPLNRLDAEIWYSSSEWAVWRRRLTRAEQLVGEMAVGDLQGSEDWCWLPWAGGMAGPASPTVRRTFAPALTAESSLKNSLWCCGQVLDGPVSPSIHRAGELLQSHGVHLANILTNSQGLVLSCTTQCQIPDTLVSRVSNRIVEVFHAHLSHR